MNAHDEGTGKASADQKCCDHAPAPAPTEAVVPQGDPGVFRIATMDCAVEESEIRRALAPVTGVLGVTFQLSARTIKIDAPVTEGLWRLGLALALAIAAESVEFFAPGTLMFKGIGMALAVIAIGLAGISTYRKGLASLRRGRFNINALMAVAVTGAFLIGQWPEAAMVMALYAIAELIEARALDRARNAIKSLLDLAPETAELRQPDGSWQEVPATQVGL